MPFKPIVGVEAYCARRSRLQRDKDYKAVNAEGKTYIVDQSGWHLILLAKNMQGYRNLCKIVSASFMEDSYYRRPRIDKDLLMEYHEGIICCSACLGGELSQKIMEALAPAMGENGAEYGALAEKVAASFRKFWMEDKGYLKDVLSGTTADEQIRCNQIWAVSMPFTMLTPSQQRSVVSAVYEHLYTPCGLRTLSPDDKSFHPFYGGSQKTRDMAYPQGTVWTFPLGGY
mgnify:CR=1 FL=1